MAQATGYGSSVYVPGKYYNCTGLTPKIWKSPQVMRAVPVERGFIDQPGAAGRAIIAVNLTERDYYAALAEDKPLSKKNGDQFWNEPGVDTVLVPAGTSTHFPASPDCFRVSVSEFQISADAKKYNMSLIGENYQSMRNKNIVIAPAERDGEVRLISTNVQQKGYTSIVNTTDRPLNLVITREETAYDPSHEEIETEIRSRQPDQGPHEVSRCVLDPGCTKFLLIPLDVLTLYWLCPNTEDDHNPHWKNSIPTSRDYIECSKCHVRAGQVGVLLETTDHLGVVAETSNYSDIKPVSPDCAQTKREVI